MSESGKNNHDHLCGDIRETECNKLLNPTRSDTCQPLTVTNEVVKVSVDVAKKRSPPNRKKNGKGIAIQISGVDGVEARKASKHETLHALVPNLPAKVDKSKIVYEAVNCIRKLQNTFNKLENEKLKSLEENNIMLVGSQKVGNKLEKYAGDLDQPVILQLLQKLIMVLVPLFQ
uniref:BHLH domain-containing protein n=1 Tax=Solanum lycopersicum TaxID=4081 RepID=A0A3Q7ETU7_SOLLC